MIFNKRKYFLLYLIPVILSIIVGTFLIYELQNSYHYEIRSAEVRNSGIAVVIALRLAGAFREIGFIMQDVHDHVSSDQLAFASGTTGPETSELNQLLLRKIRTHRWLSGLGVMNKNGVFVGAVNRNRPQDVGADFSFREYFSYLASNKNENQYFSPEEKDNRFSTDV